MCVAKDDAKTKVDRLIDGMERLTTALETAFGRYPEGNSPKSSAPRLRADSPPPQPESQEICLGSI